MQNCIGITVCTQKRVKPFELNSKIDLNAKDKQLMASVFKSESDLKQNTKENNKSRQNSDFEKDIEECGKSLPQTNIETKTIDKPKSAEDKGNQNEEQSNHLSVKKESQLLKQFKEIIESERNSNDLKNISKPVLIKESIYSSEEETTQSTEQLNRVRPKSTSELMVENEPIFMPLNPSFGQNGRISRLSFTNRKDFIVPSVSPDMGLKYELGSAPGLGLINPNHVFVGYNDYNKLIANSVRLNPLNQKLQKINKNQTINRINKLEINSNDLTLIQNNIRNQI